jgi:cation:H+ antiporter
MGAMAYGNAIGSIICNTSLIAAITIAIKPGKADRKTIIFPVCFFFGAAAFYAVNAYAFGKFSRISGIILLIGFVVYMVTLVLQMLKKPLEPESLPLEITDSEIGDGKLDPDEVDSIIKPIVFLILGAAVIAVGADLLVENGTKIAETLGVPQTVIALTFVALGTSLPELVTAITSLAKGHGALSLGNIIGANLFNLVLVSGVAISINPFDVPSAATIAGMNASFVLDIPVMFAVMALMTLPVIFRGKLSRWQGITLLCIYAAYCTMQFVMPLMA